MQPAKKTFNQNPLFFAFAAFALGILAANLAGLAVWCAIFAIAAAAAFVFRQNKWSGFGLLLLFVALGAVCFQLNIPNSDPDGLKNLLDSGRLAADEPAEIEGTIRGLPEQSVDAAIVDLDVDSILAGETVVNTSGRLRLFVRIDSDDAEHDLKSLNLHSGSKIRVTCSPDRSERFQNPGVMPRSEILERQGIDAVANVKSPLLIERLGGDVRFSPFDAVQRWRQGLIAQIRENLNQKTAGILIASLLGNRRFLDRDTAELFRDGGTFHILVISGLHITFIGGLILFLVSLFTRRRFIQFVSAASLLWIYAAAVGAGSPVVRATVMFTIFLFGYAIYRTNSLLNSLGACGLLLLAWRPADLFDPSFQLTMVSVGAIVMTAFPLIEKLRSIGNWTPSAKTPLPPNVSGKLRRFCETIYWQESAWQIESARNIWSAAIFKKPFIGPFGELRNIFRYLFEGVVVSLVVQIWMLPLLVIYFHRVSLSSVILNLWVGVILAVESFAALISVGLAQISSALAAPFVWLTEMMNSLLTGVPRLFIENGFGSLRMPTYSGSAVSIYFIYFIPVLIVAIAINIWQPFALKRSSKKLSLAMVAVAVLLGSVIVFHPYSEPVVDGKLHISFLDVGQGDSAFIVFPNGETMLVDGGGRIDLGGANEGFEPDVPRIGEAVVSEYLWDKGYSNVDHLAASHPDIDHVQGLEDVSRNFRIVDLLYASGRSNDADMDELLRIADRRKIRRVELKAGDSFEIGGALIEILNPPPGEDRPLTDNNSSVVFRLTYKNAVFLFTGDIEQAAEEYLLSSGESLKANVIKVPHHGSRTSSSQGFVDAVDADYAIISIGKRSIFGHPHKEVVERWMESGAHLMTTGQKGTITFVTDGEEIFVDSFVK